MWRVVSPGGMLFPLLVVVSLCCASVCVVAIHTHHHHSALQQIAEAANAAMEQAAYTKQHMHVTITKQQQQQHQQNDDVVVLPKLDVDYAPAFDKALKQAADSMKKAEASSKDVPLSLEALEKQIAADAWGLKKDPSWSDQDREAFYAGLKQDLQDLIQAKTKPDDIITTYNEGFALKQTKDDIPKSQLLETHDDINMDMDMDMDMENHMYALSQSLDKGTVAANFQTTAEQLEGIYGLLNWGAGRGGLAALGGGVAAPVTDRRLRMTRANGDAADVQVWTMLDWNHARRWSTNVHMGHATFNDELTMNPPFRIGGAGTSASGSVFAFSRRMQYIVKTMRPVDVDAWRASRPGYIAYMAGVHNGQTYSSKLMRLLMVVHYTGKTLQGTTQEAWWQVMVNALPGGTGCWTKNIGGGGCDIKHYRIGHEGTHQALCTGLMNAGTTIMGSVAYPLDEAGGGARFTHWHQLASDYLFLKRETLIDHSLMLTVARPTAELTTIMTNVDLNDFGFLTQETGVGPLPVFGAGLIQNTQWRLAVQAKNFVHVAIIDILMLEAARLGVWFTMERKAIAVNFGCSANFVEDQPRKAFQWAAIFLLRGATHGPIQRSQWLITESRVPPAALPLGAGPIAIGDIRSAQGVAGPAPLGPGLFANFPIVAITPAVFHHVGTAHGYRVHTIHRPNGEGVWTPPIVKNGLVW